MKTIVHIAPHYGGGVGRALESVSRIKNLENGTPLRHIFISLEIPDREAALARIKKNGADVIIAPSTNSLHATIMEADVLQLEWWNHPALFNALTAIPPVVTKTILWSHQSGTVTPIIPAQLIEISNKIVFTAPCSLRSERYRGAINSFPSKFDVISSAAGCEELPRTVRTENYNKKLRYGYVGTLSYSKLHNEFVELIASVNEPKFVIEVYGDEVNKQDLKNKCAAIGRDDLLQFKGYKEDIITELQKLDVLIYLLNPRHYGTAENALIEAMAMGVVPVVMGNQAEMDIVADRSTGFIVRKPEDLSQAIEKINTNRRLLAEMSENASSTVRSKYTFKRLETKFKKLYNTILEDAASEISFRDVLGANPSDWFLSVQGESEIFGERGEIFISPDGLKQEFYDETKGSVFHYLKYFSGDEILRRWANTLTQLKQTITS